jgi:hypothetical protein
METDQAFVANLESHSVLAKFTVSNSSQPGLELLHRPHSICFGPTNRLMHFSRFRLILGHPDQPHLVPVAVVITKEIVPIIK